MILPMSFQLVFSILDLSNQEQKTLATRSRKNVDMILCSNTKEGALKEHMHCRESASLFDVSHMG